MKKSSTLITLDIDWAPDWMIELAAEILLSHKIPATWFVTHKSAALDFLRDQESFEVGWHPNFFPGSTQGQTVSDVLAFCRDLVPEAKSVRSHSLYQSERHLEVLTNEFGIRNDCSMYMPVAGEIEPHEVAYSDDGSRLRRLPHFFQDNMNLYEKKSWDCRDKWYDRAGPRVFCFHPIHIALNTHSMNSYEALKKKRPLQAIEPRDVSDIDHTLNGTGFFFRNLVESLSPEESVTVDQYCTAFFEHGFDE